MRSNFPILIYRFCFYFHAALTTDTGWVFKAALCCAPSYTFFNMWNGWECHKLVGPYDILLPHFMRSTSTATKTGSSPTI
jgi:hypothetical protein